MPFTGLQFFDWILQRFLVAQGVCPVVSWLTHTHWNSATPCSITAGNSSAASKRKIRLTCKSYCLCVVEIIASSLAVGWPTWIIAAH